MLKFGSGQTSGLPLLLSAAVLAAAQTLHTAPAGAGTPQVVRIDAINLDPGGGQQQVTILLYDNAGTLVGTFAGNVVAQPNRTTIIDTLVLNGASVIKCYAGAANKVAVSAVIDDQTGASGSLSQTLASGLVALVQNASRFAVNAQGGTGQATRVNGEIEVARAGVLRNLRAHADATIGGGATVTVSVFVNGVASALALSLAAADTTVAKTDSDAISVNAGDKVTFSFATDNAGAPAANAHASVEFV